MICPFSSKAIPLNAALSSVKISFSVYFLIGKCLIGMCQCICLQLTAVPGLLYSLTMDNNASEEALLSMAKQIYTPVQGG